MRDGLGGAGGPRVIVVGAGMAGLVAARALAERGASVVVLEGRDRVGGRVFSRKADGASVELGAEFVHGRPPELWALLDEAGLQTTERDGTVLRAGFDGQVVEDDPQDGAMFSVLEELRDYKGPDVGFAEYVKGKALPAEERAAVVGYVEGFNAADAQRIGVHGLAAQQAAEDAIEGERVWHVRGGYGQLADYLAAKVRELGAEIRLGETMRELEWGPGRVRVTTRSRGVYTAEKCVLTLPLGVLHRVNRGGAKIVPEPPALEAARRLAMGGVVRFSMVFRRPWWEDAPVAVAREKLRQLSFMFTFGSLPPVWWTPHPEPGRAVLTGWVGGPRAAALAGQTAEQLAASACQTLGRVFGMAEGVVWRELVSAHAHDWSGDSCSLGAYSYVPAGAMDAPRLMCEPAEGTVFFAGEHTDVTGHWGTVHAAVRSGLRVAAQVLGEAGSF